MTNPSSPRTHDSRHARIGRAAPAALVLAFALAGCATQPPAEPRPPERVRASLAPEMPQLRCTCGRSLRWW